MGKHEKRRTWINSPEVDTGGKDKVWLTVSVKPEYKRRVEECAIKRGITMSQLIRDAIDEAVLAHEG